ncbi:MAG: HD domain-containing protein [Alphaproteobacteria bacterium]|nr:HD domain-containing protein [Alphaproteobacteria bacterium]MBV9370717.1 HD domain-containing protein [Alphaproteobacteria bacterium]MBV9900814.1 HD domain-containing protein [Alphaproteobacteria bacterium]
MFTDMRNGTAGDWAHIAAEHGRHQKSAAARQIMDSLARLKEIEVGFAADQLTHSLMAGTLARRAGASDEEVVAALCHDLGKLFSIPNHGAIAAEMLKPYVREDLYHAIYWHQEFQGRYYFEHLGKDPEGRERFRDEPWYAFAEKLVDEWDAPAFDPSFDVDPLESFEPEVTRVFSNPRAMV